ncbi:probable DNA-directed RNA polymerase [Gastrolobium bilobum]|uniref:probable DNA-directed RNA polymerase n=1 Tax=Gastrolobium bilobum TaxID=150636 RepID=UPI002AAF13E1|nr:probable DNA-directed RNA polymerase [Gastrolobium bilobum]
MGESPRTLSDLSGGYLSGPTGDIYDRYRLLSSGNLNHFYIDIGKNGGDSKKLCDVMNKLQLQAFQINSDWLKYLLDNEMSFVESVCKDIQCSRYEDFIIKLALAYDGYHFDLPAFLDFRGRIYRSGVLHFHERDLARSLILFAGTKPMESISNDMKNPFFEAAAFHFKNFPTAEKAHEWLYKNVDQINKNPSHFALEAKRPFQFFANMIGLTAYKMDVLRNTPITQDASASAYQIMSYFLLDETMAKRTNLIPSSDGEIQDVYAFFLEELKEFMKVELPNNLSTIVCKYLTRKHVKGIFMPKIYGKTLMSTANDLKEHLSHYITHKECFVVASACFKFWKERYPGMECLIRLIRHIGWIASAGDRPVFYKVPYFTTVQDYMIMEPTNIWVYDRLHKKRRKVTLRVSSSKRDRRKTDISTFVNFIHQKDANIAMNVVEEMLSFNEPIYTVHENFLSTATNSNLIPMIYSNVIRNMGPPLSIINEFIYMNVMKHIIKRDSIKTSNCESALDQEHEQLNSLEARFSKIEEEREQLAVEIRYLQAKDAEFLKQQDSLVAEFKKANEGISRKLAELEERSPETRL